MEAEIKKLQEFYWSDADPDGRGFVNLANAYRKGGDLEEALRILRDGLRRHPDLASGHVVAGWACVDQGDSPEAETAFRAALEIDPANVAALRGLGELLSLRGDPAGALDTYRVLVPLDPLDRNLPLRIEELEATVDSLSTDRAEAPDESGSHGAPELWDDPEKVAEELDWDSAALQEDQSHLTEDDDSLDEGESEVADASVSADALKDDTLVTRTMGDIFLRQGLFGEAEQVFEQVLERDPQAQEVREKLDYVRSLKRGEIASEAFGSRPFPKVPLSENVVPIEELGAEVVLPIEDLAPDRILPIAELAPEITLPIEALAPDPEAGDPALDAFEAWLDKLP